MFAFELARRADLQRAAPARRAWVPRGEEVAAAEAPTKAAGAVAKATAGAATGAAANFKGLQQPQEQSLAHGQHWVADSSTGLSSTAGATNTCAGIDGVA